MEPWYEGSTRAPGWPWGGKGLQGSTGFHKGPPRLVSPLLQVPQGLFYKGFQKVLQAFCTGLHEAEVTFYKAPQGLHKFALEVSTASFAVSKAIGALN